MSSESRKKTAYEEINKIRDAANRMVDNMRELFGEESKVERELNKKMTSGVRVYLTKPVEYLTSWDLMTLNAFATIGPLNTDTMDLPEDLLLEFVRLRELGFQNEPPLGGLSDARAGTDAKRLDLAIAGDACAKMKRVFGSDPDRLEEVVSYAIALFILLKKEADRDGEIIIKRDRHRYKVAIPSEI